MGRLGTHILTCLDDMIYYGYNTTKTILIERGVWGPTPEKF